MSRIIDFLRNNLFWVLMVLVIGAMAGVYVFVAQGMAARVEKLRREGSQVIESLRRLAAKPSIPNEKMSEAAKREETALTTLHGQVLVMFASRSGGLDRDFDALRGVDKPDLHHVLRWWQEYERRTGALLLRTRESFETSDKVLTFAVTPPSPTVRRSVIEREQGRFWRLAYTIDTLRVASPKDDPLITKLLSVKLRGRVRKLHDWVRGRSVVIKASMPYENVGTLVAALQNSPKPLLVRKVRSTQTDIGDGASALAKPPGPTMTVSLTCEIVEFRPAVRQATFGGKLFKKSDAVKEWVAEQERDLHVATVVLLKGVGGLKDRAEVLLGATLKDAWKAAREAREKELEKIDADAPAGLKQKIEAAKVNGKISDARRKAVEKTHAGLIAKAKEAARKRYARAEFGITAKAGGFSLVYDHLRPVVAQKAYFIGLSSGQRRYLMVRAPDSDRRAGRWWIARAKGGKAYAAKDDVKPRARRREIIQGITGGTPRQTAIMVDRSSAVGPVLFANESTGEMVQALVARPGGGWRTYPVVSVEKKPVSVSDAAFRFAPVVGAIAPLIDTPAFKPASKQVTVLPKAALAKGREETFSVPVREGAGGNIKVVIGFRP
jgi:hypothetical protein